MFMFSSDLDDDTACCEWCGKEYYEDESDASNTTIFCSARCEDECLSGEDEE